LEEPVTTTVSLHPQVLEMRQKVQEAAAYIKSKISVKPRIAVILGSGLGELADEVENAVAIPYGEIPNFPVSTAPGHAGRLVIGTLAGQPVMLMQGRFHLYEGYSAQLCTLPVRVFREMGVETLVVTCAAGGLNRNFKAGDIMLITDHINLTGTNPLIGPNDAEVGPRFPVMFDAYRPELRQKALKIAMREGIRIQEGVYVGISGPAFTTPAELRQFMLIGADSIGMSTVSEVITAVHCGLKVLGISNITDMAIPDFGHHATEQEVLEVAKATGPVFRRLLKSVIAEI
jgi:purine-nucleoside phosphorylase